MFCRLIPALLFCMPVLAQQSAPAAQPKEKLPHPVETVRVVADKNSGDILTPDPAVKVLATEDLLDANPGRPGAPISIPGYPVETASSGIKAPQYFAPGVAGDHGEPIAQYLQLGTALIPNNLSANAHGNGYADPNLFIASMLESVQVDGGAFNAREGNHALNLAAVYGLRTHFAPFFALTGDQRDLTATFATNLNSRAWFATEASIGNGFLSRLEHRKQFKLNAGELLHLGPHTLSLAAIAYYGTSYLAGLKPLHGFNAIDAAAGWTLPNPDSIDPRQRDQTHTSLLAASDDWQLNARSSLALSAYFRTYNLALYSDFGLGLIRQSEFRTVLGVESLYQHQLAPHATLLVGLDFEREAPRRVNLDHYNFFSPAEPATYGPFVKITSNNVTITPLSPFIATQGNLGAHINYYLGWRQELIALKNTDLITPVNSWSRWAHLGLPKATLTYLPGTRRLLPTIALSFGKSFFTEDPRMSAGSATSSAHTLVELARSYQLVFAKTLGRTELKLTLGHETQTAEYGKIDADQGLPENNGPGRNRYLAFTLRQALAHGAISATWEQADARLVDAPTSSITPEAPRSIADLTANYDALPLKLRAKFEFEYVGQKVLGTGCDTTLPNGGDAYCLGAANKEFRFALARPFANNRINMGLNAMLARGFTGQTTENFAAASVYSPGAVGLDANNLVPADPVSEAVGVRIPSYASLSLTWRFGREGK